MKLSSYESPISGKASNLFDVSDLWGKVLGVVVFVMVFIFGQKIADYLFPVATAKTDTTPAPSKTPVMRFL